MASENSQNRVSWPVAFGEAPRKGSRSMTQILDFTLETSVGINLTFEQSSERIEFVQAMFIDNSLNGATLTLTFRGTGQILKIPGGYQGYVPVLATAEHCTLTATTSGTPLIPVQFLSFPVPACLWQATNAPAVSQAIDGSGTLTTALTPQTIFTGVIPASGFAIYNPDATNDLWVSDSTTALANGAGSIRIQANGGWFETPPFYKPIGAVSLVGAANAQKFTARRW